MLENYMRYHVEIDGVASTIAMNDEQTKIFSMQKEISPYSFVVMDEDSLKEELEKYFSEFDFPKKDLESSERSIVATNLRHTEDDMTVSTRYRFSLMINGTRILDDDFNDLVLELF